MSVLCSRLIHFIAAVFISAVSLLVAGCAGDDDNPAPAQGWAVTRLWEMGTHPVPSLQSGYVLFYRETGPSGLYLQTGGEPQLVNPQGPPARLDYAWSPSGTRFCFSSPGESGSPTAGIYFADVSAPTSFVRLWDRGSGPEFLADEMTLICAGPEDGGPDEGIWQIDVGTRTRSNLAPRGVAPSVSPDGFVIGYLVALGDPSGHRTLVVLDRRSSERDTLLSGVLSFDWLSDSQTLVAEAILGGFPQIVTLGMSEHNPRAVGSGTHPARMPAGTEFVFTGIVADRNNGLWISAPERAPAQISTVGTFARAMSQSRILAQDSLGIIQLSR